VLRKPGGDRSADPEIVELMFGDPSEAAQARLRAFYVHASAYLVAKGRIDRDERLRARAAAKAAAARS
jgi:hypothetical protein